MCSIRDPLSIDKVEGPLRAAYDRTNGIHPTPGSILLDARFTGSVGGLDARHTMYCMSWQMHTMWVIASILSA